MKKRITKADHSELDPAIQGFYKKAEGSDNYVLDLEDDDDAGELKRAKDAEKKRADAAERKAKEAQERLDELEAEAEAARVAAGKGLDEAGVQRLKDSYEKKLIAAQNDLAASRSTITNLTVDRAAAELASEMSTVPDIFANTIRSRFGLELVDGKPAVVVLGEDGQPSGKTVADLKAEFLANPKYAPILVASKAVGGGAAKAMPGGGATGKRLNEMSATEEAAFANENPAAYEKMLAEG